MRWPVCSMRLGQTLWVFAIARAMVVMACDARASGAAHRELVAAMHSKPDLERGAELFQTCAGCQGSEGEGVRDGRVPRIAGQHASVLIEQLVDYRHNHRWDPYMEHLADWPELPDAQALADVAGLRLRDEVANGKGNGELVRRGAGQYARLCLRCHGAHGEGDARHAIPRERQIYDAVDGRRPSFCAPHIRLLARLERDDIVGVADYISRLPLDNGGGTTPGR